MTRLNRFLISTIIEKFNEISKTAYKARKTRRNLLSILAFGISIVSVSLASGTTARANTALPACDPAFLLVYAPPTPPPTPPCKWVLDDVIVVDAKWTGNNKKALDEALSALIAALKASDSAAIATPAGNISKAIKALGPGGDVIESVTIIYICTDTTGVVHRKTYSVDATDVDLWGAKMVKFGGKENKDARDKIIEKNRPKGSCCIATTAGGTTPTPPATPPTNPPVTPPVNNPPANTPVVDPPKKDEPKKDDPKAEEPKKGSSKDKQPKEKKKGKLAKMFLGVVVPAAVALLLVRSTANHRDQNQQPNMVLRRQNDPPCN